MTKKIGRFLESIIGEVIEIDEGESGDCDGKYIRVRVMIDVEKPLRRCLRIDVLGDGVESVMLIKYECLPDHCFQCGRLGHKTRECTVAVEGQTEDGSYEFLFGLWL
ncbi:hypothetical protein EZV62_026127 [Acer yangbiense]|uniref:CCHC-type domain-containing protein n=1 Tax=Acer yangbiense TaxID=1000413 RepID=A0A5C7GQH6_9ROSI|nr:hypothetical protein EZV62_026127 [Acer yangbiense]